ncbi:MAG: P22 coat protein - protein 5 domain protein, partial [bacterium]
YMVESSVEMARVLDKYIASLYVHAANTIGSGTTPESIADVSEAYDYLIDLLTKLDESDVPEAGRFIVLPPKVAAMVAKDRSLFAPAPEGLANAVGAIEDVTIFKSNNIPTDETVQRVIAGYKGAITFANQFVEVEALRSASHFSDIVRGLNVFGAKVVRPEGLAVLTLEK